MRLFHILPWYVSRWHSRSNDIKNLVKIHRRIPSNFFLFPLFILVSIELTVINTFSAIVFDLRVRWINLETFSAALIARCSVVCGSSMPLSRPMSDSLSTSQLSSLSFELSKSAFQWSRFSVSEMLPGAQSSSLSAGWQLIVWIWCTFNPWVRPPGRSFADKPAWTGDLSENLDALAPSCWRFAHDDLVICSLSKLYSMAFIFLFWARDSFCVAWRVWLPCHISKKLWSLAILYNCLSSASLLLSKSFLGFVISYSGSSRANIPLLAQANCLKTIYWEWSCRLFLTDSSRERLTNG